MSTKAGDRARRSGDFVCNQCGKSTPVNEGELIPACSYCSNKAYNEIKEFKIRDSETKKSSSQTTR